MLTKASEDNVNKNKKTRNLLVQSQASSSNYISIFISELLPKVVAFKVNYVLLNLDTLSPFLAIGPGMPMNIIVYSNEFGSLSNNNYSYVDGIRRNTIASYPIHFGDFMTNGTRTTLRLKIRQPWTRLTTPSNINRMDFSLGFSPISIPFILGPTDKWTIAIDLKNKGDSA